MSRLLLSGFLLLICLFPVKAEEERFKVYVPRPGADLHDPPAYKIFSDGRFEKLELRAGYKGGGVSYGLRAALVSPDQEWIAYTRENDLWLYAVHSATEVRITSDGRPFEQPMREVFVSIKAWSPDSELIVYRVNHHHGPTMDYRGPPLQLREADYGFHVYDLKSRKSRKLDEATVLADYLFAKHVAWLTRTSFLVKSSAPGDTTDYPVQPRKINWVSGPSINPTNYFRVSSSGNEYRFVGTIAGSTIQEQVSADREKMVLHASLRKRSERSAYTQIWSMNLEKAKSESVTRPGYWNHRHQLPKYSPDGYSIAYLCQRAEYADEQDLRSRIEANDVVVDGRSLFAAKESGVLLYEWIDGKTLVIQSGRQLLVVDTDEGLILGQLEIPPEPDPE